MQNIKDMLEKDIPFSIVQYFESLKIVKSETHKKYELIYVNKRKQLSFKDLTHSEICVFKNNTDLMELKIDNEDGRVWEYNNFKDYLRSNKIKYNDK